MSANSRKSAKLPRAPRLLIAYPQVLVSDVRRASAFYVDKLGFAVVYLYGEPPFYGLVQRDGVGLNLRHVDHPEMYHPNEKDLVLSANIPVQGVTTLFQEYQRRGVAFAQILREQPWGTTDFLVRDPDGNLLCFASTVDDSSKGQGGNRDRVTSSTKRS